MTPDPILADLIAANNLIADPRKWTKGRFFDIRTGAMCMLGACGHRAYWEDIYRSGTPSAYLREVVKQSNWTTFVPEWQDAPERTHAEVMAVFAKAIDMRRQELGIPTMSVGRDPSETGARGFQLDASGTRSFD